MHITWKWTQKLYFTTLNGVGVCHSPRRSDFCQIFADGFDDASAQHEETDGDAGAAVQQDPPRRRRLLGHLAAVRHQPYAHQRTDRVAVTYIKTRAFNRPNTALQWRRSCTCIFSYMYKVRVKSPYTCFYTCIICKAFDVNFTFRTQVVFEFTYTIATVHVQLLYWLQNKHKFVRPDVISSMSKCAKHSSENLQKREELNRFRSIFDFIATLVQRLQVVKIGSEDHISIAMTVNARA